MTVNEEDFSITRTEEGLRIKGKVMFEESWLTKLNLVKSNFFYVYKVLLKIINVQSQHYKNNFVKDIFISAYMNPTNKYVVGKKRRYFQATDMQLEIWQITKHWLQWQNHIQQYEMKIRTKFPSITKFYMVLVIYEH